ncbi:hypothetical protein KSP40_PGU018803 [Platanthera guangdongensis]|uniref:SUI1 domain-containing protein n=1 Tax=Platanthera guangdongensis TaxID=2320717 RepID=A0ABR2MDY7_9ASPA
MASQMLHAYAARSESSFAVGTHFIHHPEKKLNHCLRSVNVSPSDPFAEANADNAGAGSKEYVHIRVQQRNGRKSLTTVQGLKKAFSKTKILKDLKKEFCCNGTVVEDPELGQAGIVKEQIKIHGF